METPESLLDEDQLMRFADVMVRKALSLVEELPQEQDPLTSIIQLVVADTWLMSTGKIPFSEWMYEEVGDRVAVGCP